MIMHQLDEIDKKIISVLEVDAHMSSMQMSKQLNVCAPTIRRRINRLIKNDIMRIQAVQINRAKISIAVTILLKVESNAITRTADLLASQKEVGFIVLTAGYFNIVCLGWFESVESYSRFLNTILYPINGVLDMDTLICTEYRKYAFIKMNGAANQIKPANKPVDDIDMRIIEALEKDARQKSTRLAKSLNISAPTIRCRINDLLNNNIIHIQAFPNLRMGKTIAAVIALKVANGAVNRIADCLCDLNEVRQVLLYSGTYDIGVWAWFESIEAFSEFLKNVINPLEGVEKKEISIQTEIRKWVHMW
ncbi:MAG: Lrp/AsnC family transcriptional regulator [Dehalococcoidia bacterium]|nr:Lrp/AsnC family transcriptional regulator [Dehalococcoidia bacterium]